MKFVGLILAITLSLVLALGVFPSLQADNMLAQADSDNTTVQLGGGGGGGGGSDNATVELKVEVVPRRGGGGGGGAAIYYIDTDLFGVLDRYRISRSGELRETIEATSADGMLAITVPEDTVALDKDGKRLKSLVVAIDESPPSPPKDARIIGLAYDLSPEAATFAPPLTLTWSYDPDALPEGIDEENLVVAYYDEDSGKWIELDCVVDTVNNTITAPVGHFTTFALIGTVRLPPPAAFAVTDLSILPAEVYVGDSLSITVIATNTGGQSGSCEVTLKINDVVEATKEVTVSPGLSKKVTFTVSKDIPSIYSVDVDGLTASFIVKTKAVPPVIPPAKPFPWPLVGGIIAGGLIVGFLIFFLARRRVA